MNRMYGSALAASAAAAFLMVGPQAEAFTAPSSSPEPASSAVPPAVRGTSDGSSVKRTTLFSDHFSSGFDTSASGKWELYPGIDDGIATTSSKGLKVVPTGKNPLTGKPAFVNTAPQAGPGEAGTNDHGKFVVFPRATSTAGAPGFDTPAKGSLTCSTTMSVTTSGTEQNPFPRGYVTDPQSDLRLASGLAATVDLQSGMAFDFFVTNKEIYAYYERIRQPGSTYAAFSYSVPVAARRPGQQNNYQVVLDDNRTRVTWKVDGHSVLTVNRIGTRALDRKYMTLDEGGPEEIVAPGQLTCGVASFTLLDGAGPNGRGLVRLDSEPHYYFAPKTGAPVAQKFFDDHAMAGNRLWGQGVELDVRSLDITKSE